jgi:hypothetical protein
MIFKIKIYAILIKDIDSLICKDIFSVSDCFKDKGKNCQENLLSEG